MSGSAAPTCTVRPYAATDEPEVLNLLQASLAGGPTGRRTAEFFRWKHEANPFGTSLALVAEAGDRIVGFRTFQRWRFTVHGEPVHAVRAVDTATHPDAQGQGIFTRLTLAALEDARTRADLVFNTPNSKSLPGYLKMGWSTVGVVPIQLRPVRPIRFARNARGATRVIDRSPAGKPGAGSGAVPKCSLPTAADVLSDEPAVADLLAQTARDPSRLATERSMDYLRWRYAQAPDLGYRAVAARSGGDLIGLAIGRPRWRGRLAEFTLSEVLVRGHDSGTARRLMRAVVRAGCDHVAAHFSAGTSMRRAGYAAGFVSWPGVGMTLATNPLRRLRPDPRQATSWRLALGDLELF